MMKDLLVVVMICLGLAWFSPGYSQIDLKGKIKNRIENKVDQGIDKGLDKVEEGGKKAVTKKKDEGEQDENSDEAGAKGEEGTQNGESKNAAGNKGDDKPSFQTYSKYDFVPGDKVIFYEDFSQDNIGDYPALWFSNKGGEVMTTNNYPGKWFMMKEDGQNFLEKPIDLPENYTLEFDVIPMAPAGTEPQSIPFDLNILATEPDDPYPSMGVPGKSGIGIRLSTPNGSHTYSGYADQAYTISGDYSKEQGLLKANEVNHIAFWIQKSRLRLYIHGEKIFDLPKVLRAGDKYNQFRFSLDGETSPLFSNFRIAAAGADLRSKLLTEGKIVSYGIYFDSGKDVVKPESYGTLKTIAAVLTENPSVRIKIVGHTDSDGDDKMNMSLSKKRGEAVKAALNAQFNIDLSRMEADGKGESEPIAPNTNAEGKAKNRRVEFIKL